MPTNFRSLTAGKPAAKSKAKPAPKLPLAQLMYCDGESYGLLLKQPRVFACIPVAIIPCSSVAEARAMVKAGPPSKRKHPTPDTIARDDTLARVAQRRIAEEMVRAMNPMEAQRWVDRSEFWPQWALDDVDTAMQAFPKLKPYLT